MHTSCSYQSGHVTPGPALRLSPAGTHDKNKAGASEGSQETGRRTGRDNLSNEALGAMDYMESLVKICIITVISTVSSIKCVFRPISQYYTVTSINSN